MLDADTIRRTGLKFVAESDRSLHYLQERSIYWRSADTGLDFGARGSESRFAGAPSLDELGGGTAYCAPRHVRRFRVEI